MGKPAALPATTEPGPGAALLVDSARRATRTARLPAATPEVLATLARGFAAAPRDRHPPGPAALATWPAAVPALAHRLYGARRGGILARRLPIFGPWLFRGLTPSRRLAGALATHAFRALAATDPPGQDRPGTPPTAGVDAANLGTHSLRRGAAAALFRAGGPRPLSTQAPRRASARSDESCVREAVCGSG